MKTFYKWHTAITKQPFTYKYQGSEVRDGMAYTVLFCTTHFKINLTIKDLLNARLFRNGL